MITHEINFICDGFACDRMESSEPQRNPVMADELEKLGAMGWSWRCQPLKPGVPHLLCPDCLRKGKTHP